MAALFALLALAVFLTPALSAQSTAGSLVGTITDASGAVVPGAKLTATNQETAVIATATSNATGAYKIFPLAPGTYDLTVEKEAFRQTKVKGIVLDVNSTIATDLRLQVGARAEEVTVSATEVSMVAETISVESVVAPQQLDTLPLNGRDFNDLVLLASGATDNTVATNINLDFGPYAVNGNRSFSNSFMVNGVTNDNVYQGSSATKVSVDAIQEFKVISGVPPAEYGHAATAITAVTKNGTNAFHGSLYEYYRGNVLLANNPFDTMAGKETFLRNQFGGSIGGPIVIPRVVNGRNKTFFFFNYEGVRQTDTAVRVDTVPLPEMWAGNFSSLLPTIQLRDPLTSGRPNIPGNRLDLYKGGALISQTALKLRTFYADPNLPGIVNNLIQFPDETVNSNQFTARVDHAFARNQSLSASMTFSNISDFEPNLLGTPTVGLTQPEKGRNAAIIWTAPIGNTMVNELRFGAMNYSLIATYLPGDRPTIDTLGMGGFDPQNPGIPYLPQMTFSGSGAFTQIKYGPTTGYGEAALHKASNIFTVADTLSMTKGNHGLKFGFEGRRDYFNYLQQSQARGSLSFSGSSSSSVSTGYSFANFLIGVPTSASQVPVHSNANLLESEYAGFAQDAWKVRSNLTLTLGVRYEYSPSPQDKLNRLAMFSGAIPGGGFVVACANGQLPTDQFLSSVIQKLTNTDGSLKIPIECGSKYGYNDDNLVETGKNNWGPRIGVSWDPSGRGVYAIHAGYGTVYTRYPLQYFGQTMLANPPFAASFPYSQRITTGVAAITLDNPYGGSGSVSVSANGLVKNFVLPNNQQWNLQVTRRLSAKNAISIAYIGNKGSHLFRSFNVNQPYLDTATGVVVRPFSGVFGTTSIPVRSADANSIYNAMAVEFRRRVATGFNIQANWTWAKAIDDVGTNVQSAGLDILSPGRDRADSDYARRHSISLNSSYQFPVGHRHTFGSNMPGWADAVIGGWSLSGIWHWTTGRFLTVTQSSQGGLSSTRPDQLPDVSPNLPRDQRTKDHWFNPAAFVAVNDTVTGYPRFGNASRNSVIGPGLNVVDLNLRKSFPLGERRRIACEVSLFNAFNHPNWGNPDMNISNSNTAGTINTLSKPMRQAQFAVRFDF